MTSTGVGNFVNGYLVQDVQDEAMMFRAMTARGNSSDNDYMTTSTQVVWHVQAGGQVWVGAWGSDIYINWGYFSEALLSADV